MADRKLRLGFRLDPAELLRRVTYGPSVGFGAVGCNQPHGEPYDHPLAPWEAGYVWDPVIFEWVAD